MTEQDDATKPPEPYLTVGGKAQFYKALIQMLVGTVGGAIVIVRVPIDVFWRHRSLIPTSHSLFVGIGLTLGVAAAVELAYTLYTYGPDEAVEPVMLGVAAALLVQLGQVSTFDLRESIAALLYVLALAGLFVVRNKLVRDHKPEGWAPAWWPSTPTADTPSTPDRTGDQ